MALTQVQPGMLASDSQYTGFKNRILNGQMMIDQRNAGASVTPTAGQYSLDRWSLSLTASSKFSFQQSSTAPTGFSNSLLFTSLSAYSVGASDFFLANQWIEGFNTADLSWGTANAKTVTLSFQVYSSLTGTFGGCITNSAQSYSYPFTYTVSSANTWTQITITIAGPTSGTWIGSTNGRGLGVWFSLGTGSTYSGTAGSWASANYYSATGATSVVGTNGATFYLTGVQLEKGSTATSFDYRPYGTELQLCQRYYQKTSGFTGIGDNSTTQIAVSEIFCVPMRSGPTIGQTGVITIENMGVADLTQSSTGITWRSSRYNSTGGCFTLQNFSGLSQYRPYPQNVNYNGTDNYVTLSAEL